jgi:hypothetical protein
MTTPNAFGFLLLGLFMLLLPPAVPGWFPPNYHLDGSSTSALWLGLMGWVNDAIGAWFLARNELLPLAERALAWQPQPLEDFAPGKILRPAVVFERDGELANDDRRAVA